MDIPNTDSVNYAFASAQSQAMQYRHEFITPEHLLSALLEQVPFQKALAECFCTPEELSQSISEYLSKKVERVPQEIEYELEISGQLSELLQYAYMTISHSSAEEMDVPHLVQGMLQLEDSWAGYLLKETVGEDMPEFLSSLISNYEHMNQFQEETSSEQEKSEPWRNYVTCLNEGLQDRNPLIGRNVELERTIQVLCRKEKNNPLHVGEPGVGKTALVYGLAARIEAGNVPERLTGCRIYELDLGNLLAGTQYRGEFEKRLKAIMEGIRKEGHAIVYIDEIHNLIGAGRTGDGSMDASNMLKPYLEGGEIRFIGSTTYEEFNRYFSRSRGLVRRFQQIDIQEPGIEETIHIVEGLKERYETFHGVVYEEGVIAYAVTAAARYISDRFLPDKAIDLVDEAGLLDENKPLASLLFVGPTGVGKTEVAKVLASELGIALQRFDMSEYTEKHTVAKLIGSPAGYIGYEDGGLLTDAIRKTPNCVLLLDEIEKAHPDIFNILLQVMDYAVLTDNKGRKADCRHVILIMTSNAGAQFAHQASIGFSGQITAGEAMLKQVKKTFKPEFINRLSATVVFHDMDYGMASLILNKKLNELKNKLSARHVGMELSPEAYKHLLKLGFTKEYGAREMDRVITSQLKPLLMREILFGTLKTGGKVRVTAGNGELSLQVLKE